MAGAPHTKWHLSTRKQVLYTRHVWECHKTCIPFMRLLACPIYGNRFSPRGWKTQDAGKKGSKSWTKINSAQWNKKWRLFTFHWSDDARETPQTRIKLKEYIFWVFFHLKVRKEQKKKLEQTEANHTSTIELLIHFTNPHSDRIKFQVEWDSQ